MGLLLVFLPLSANSRGKDEPGPFWSLACCGIGQNDGRIPKAFFYTCPSFTLQALLHFCLSATVTCKTSASAGSSFRRSGTKPLRKMANSKRSLLRLGCRSGLVHAEGLNVVSHLVPDRVQLGVFTPPLHCSTRSRASSSCDKEATRPNRLVGLQCFVFHAWNVSVSRSWGCQALEEDSEKACAGTLDFCASS